jgi:hypothetical protein
MEHIKLTNLFAISGFRGDVEETYILLRCYAALSGSAVPMCQDKLSVSSSKVKKWTC